jgi:hypothetical protein
MSKLKSVSILPYQLLDHQTIQNLLNQKLKPKLERLLIRLIFDGKVVVVVVCLLYR